MRVLVLLVAIFAVSSRSAIALPLFSSELAMAAACCSKDCPHPGWAFSCQCCQVRPDLIDQATKEPAPAPVAVIGLPLHYVQVPLFAAPPVSTQAVRSGAVPVFLELGSLRL